MSEEFFVQNDGSGDILRQISGQLRLSLANIYNALERIAPPEARDKDREMDLNAALLTQGFMRIMRIADNLEDAAVLGQPGQVQLKNADIVRFCQELADNARHPAQLLGLELAFASDADSCYIAMDAARLERLVLNLLSNAFKFTPKGGRVTLEVRVEKEAVLLLVADTGCGIGQDIAATLFARHLQPGRMEPPPHGLGLGLPVCRQVAEEHGGSILSLGNEDGGTTMVVSLPRRRVRTNRMGEERLRPQSTFNRTLVELSDALPKEAFIQKYMD